MCCRLHCWLAAPGLANGFARGGDLVAIGVEGLLDERHGLAMHGVMRRLYKRAIRAAVICQLHRVTESRRALCTRSCTSATRLSITGVGPVSMTPPGKCSTFGVVVSPNGAVCLSCPKGMKCLRTSYLCEGLEKGHLDGGIAPRTVRSVAWVLGFSAVSCALRASWPSL